MYCDHKSPWASGSSERPAAVPFARARALTAFPVPRGPRAALACHKPQLLEVDRTQDCRALQWLEVARTQDCRALQWLEAARRAESLSSLAELFLGRQLGMPWLGAQGPSRSASRGGGARRWRQLLIAS